jgi:5'-methylthioadenosine phosphorylase
MTKIAIIGGSGLENPEILHNAQHITLKTPYGDPSSDFICGSIGQVDVVLLSRHGRDHTIPPSQVNNRANLFAINQLGCTHILATTACGSLREGIGRGDLVIPDQFIDFTRHRETTFFKEFLPNKMKHTQMADPFNCYLREKLITAGHELDISIHQNGCIITIEGPRFSTRAESRMFRSWGGDMINMSTAPECILANELAIPYAAVAMATDYDSWKDDEKPVSWEEILLVFGKNVHNVINILLKVIPTV